MSARASGLVVENVSMRLCLSDVPVPRHSGAERQHRLGISTQGEHDCRVVHAIFKTKYPIEGKGCIVFD